ncbi:NAD(P)-dependent oxidoreductase [archaeon]|jgi:NAD+ dependent glucose-6-phosphate dehydrogenase|nr:NAD(P)-dependent oxidoreductase [archaeon]MBT4373432.1 NAD(P)-dependent oxidoreductase [archaeon]MBT4531880.1 NAD(P)-dependent oxidoreductase [archaeon]MBT7001547.1 NAD(P)-dependent oxidoreductase [archaeon]MBT7282561.1 NAD(P)-dependent oxidoreductase [archaeon]
MKKKVLLLGASGNIGTGFIENYLENQEYQKDYDLIIGIHQHNSITDKLKTRKFSLTDLDSLRKAFQGIDVIINLAANPHPEADFENLIDSNLIGAYNVFQIAKEKKVARVIFASSVHAIKGYDLDYKVRAEDAPKPLTIYGATKAFGEALCYTFSQNSELSCIAIRIGAYAAKEKMHNVCSQRTDYHYVVSQKDLSQLIHKTIIAPEKIKYTILAGISNNKKHSMDLELAKKLVNYNPKDDAYAICEKTR